MTKYYIENVTEFQFKDAELEVWAESVCDGDHSMKELYLHRHALLCALVKIYDNYKTPLGSHVKCIKSKLHFDGTMYEDWFIVMLVINQMDTSELQVSYHLPISWWNKFNIMEVERAPKWDGHSSMDVIQRLLEL